ncbi:MAG: hypothetical protein HRF40_10385 [Nitrososphaera sp.]|jgi:hypothetical protein
MYSLGSGITTQRIDTTVFSTPVIIYDFARYEPVQMKESLAELTESEEALLSNLYLLDSKDKERLKSTGKLYCLT